MPIRSLVLILLCTIACQVQAQYFLVHINVVDVQTGTILPDRTVCIKGYRILTISRSPHPSDGHTYDETGKYLIPGLWDMHIHNGFNDSANLFRYFPMFMANGVTGIRDMWGDPAMMRLRNGIDSGRIRGLRIVLGSPILEGPKFFWRNDIHVSTEDQGRRLVDSLADAGYDFIKVYSTLRAPVFFAIAAEARKRGLPVAGHLPMEVGFEQALDAGQRSFEHNMGINIFLTGREPAKLSWASHYLDTAASVNPETLAYDEPISVSESDFHLPPAVAERMIRDRAAIVPTLTITYGYGLPADSMVNKIQGMEYMDSDFVNFSLHAPRFFPPELIRTYGLAAKFFMNKGILVLAGTDVNNSFCVPGFGLHQELWNLHVAGLTNLQVLQTATLNPALYLHKEKDLGTVSPGKLADLVILDANPLDDIRNTQKIEAAIFNGEYFSREQLQAMLKAIPKK